MPAPNNPYAKYISPGTLDAGDAGAVTGPTAGANPYARYVNPSATPGNTQSPDNPNSPASTLGYIGSRFLGGALEGAKWLGSAASNEMGQNEQGQELANLPPGQQTVDQALYGAPNVPPPNAVARYGGAVASAAGANPALAAMTPGVTVAGVLGGEGASDLNRATGAYLPDSVARLAGGVLGSGLYGTGKAGVSAAMSAADRAGSPVADLLGNKDVARAFDQQAHFGETLMGQYQEPAQQAAEAVGPRVSATQIGRNILDKAQTWLGDQQANAQRDFSAIEAQFPEGSRVVPMRTMELLTEPSEGPPLPGIADKLADQLSKNGSISYSALKQWRSTIGREVGGGPLYDALTNDMKGALQSQAGDEAVTAFENANAGYKNARNFIEDRLGRLTDASTPPERLAGIINNPEKHATELGDLLNAGVIGKDDIAAIGRQWLEQSGRNAQGLWDPVSFSRAVGQLQAQSPEAARLMFGDNPAVAALVPRADALAATVSPFARANAPRPGILRRMLPAATGLVAGHYGMPGGELLGGYLMGHGDMAGANPLYAIPHATMLQRGVTLLGNPAAGAEAALLGQPNRPPLIGAPAGGPP